MDYPGSVIFRRREFPGADGDRVLMFRKAVIVLLLLVTPFAQARALFSCSMMNGQVVERCICPAEQHRLPKPHDESGTACCTPALEFSERQIIASAADQSARLPAKRPWDSLPVIAIVPSAPIITAAATGMAQSTWQYPAFYPASSPLYLRTARLRL